MSALKALTAVLERFGIRYLIGGSVASSARGEGRTTFDTDLLARIPAAVVEKLAGALGPEWYVDPDTARESIRAGRSFNIINKRTGDKFDIFPALGAFHESQLERASDTPIESEGDTVVCPVASAEDIILAKLQWYKDGGEVSERQWKDVLGIFGVNPDLDKAYLTVWAEELGVSALLDRAMEEASR